jgi:hypothetical protein
MRYSAFRPEIAVFRKVVKKEWVVVNKVTVVKFFAMQFLEEILWELRIFVYGKEKLKILGCEHKVEYMMPQQIHCLS